MATNMSSVDRVVRGIVGVVLILIALFLAMSTVLQVIFIVIGAILVITALIGFCPLYKLLGISTKK
jgi:uncharacterized membrane protein